MSRRLRQQERRAERGATLAGYALIFSAIAVMSLAAIEALNESSGDYLTETGGQIGEARPSRFENNAAAGSGGSSSGGGGSTPVPPAPPAASFPAGVSPDPNVPAPTLVSGEAIFPIPAGLPPSADLDGNSGWDDDDYSFIFTEGMWTQNGDQTISGNSNWGGDFDLVDGQTYCSYIYHFSPTTNEGNNPTTTIDFGNTVVGVAGSKSAMQATDDEAFLGAGNFAGSSAYNNKLENSDKTTINGTQVTFDMYAVPNGADNARIITECAPPAPPSTPLHTDVPVGSHHAPGMCLDESGGALTQRPCSATDNDQQWDVNSFGGGVVEIRSHNDLCMGVAGHGDASGAAVVEVPCGSASSTWTMTGSTPATFENVNAPGMCMDVAGGSTGNANVIIYPCGPQDNQKFNFP